MAKRIHQMTIPQFEASFYDEQACVNYLVAHRWPEGVTCPRCGYPASELTKDNHWQCYNCAPETSYRFSHLTGTVFENTNKPLKDWFRVLHMMLTSKKGISALQVMRVMGFGSYKTAWYMCHRIRGALANEDFRKLTGIVEVDETYVGGKLSNKHYKDRHDQDGEDGRHGKGGPRKNKTIVAGAVRRKGKVVARVIANAKAETLHRFIREAVSTKVSVLVTDQHHAYDSLKDAYPQHQRIDHSRKQYVVGAIHTNTIEGFWSLIKRGVVGTFHKVSPKYLPLYVAEFQFRYNNRKNDDIFGEAVRGC